MSTGTSTATSVPAPTSPRSHRLRTVGLFSVIAAMHVAAFAVLVLMVAPHHYEIPGQSAGRTQVFGIGLGITAYTLGMRHAFDADHIAAIDNTTRKLMADGRRTLSAGFWFALGHSTIVLVLAALVAAGTHAVAVLTGEGSSVHQALGVLGTSVSGGFLYLIAALNLASLAGIRRVFRSMRAGQYDEAELERQLDSRGLMNRVLGRLTRSITRPGQMFPIGLLFGVGFDTATEVTLMVMAGSGAAAGLPWYAVLCLPLLFAAGMSLFDTLDGTFMNVAYRWAFANPVRKVYYNLAVTGLSVAVAFLIGTIELVGVLHQQLGLDDPVTGWIADLDLNNVGFAVVGLFVAVWAAAVAYWRLAGVEQRWNAVPTATATAAPVEPN
ncbi:HoxN/HupN/NixA family nickel/cobalt transporter [Streptacidiphilus monticola]|uniref:Nickel/cobalt efflux system n=1 Tax=Streptacidiphilus monticola TaxID=2161674 RepID=A0ABW1GE49_9ACTN